MTQPKPHYLAKGAKSWSPDCVFVFDTESTEYDDDGTLKNILSCWDAIVTIRHQGDATALRQNKLAGEEPAALVHPILELAENYGEVWCFAHNLNFDLAVSQLPLSLAILKSELVAYGLSKESNWWSFKHNGHKIILADSWSWLPSSLATIGRDIGRRKLPLPGTGETLKTWHNRCRHDAEILSEAILELMDWWDTQNLGRWGITSAGCGWSALRSKTRPRSVVVGSDIPRTAFERSALHGGRKEVFQVGTFRGEWCADYDFRACYPVIVAHLEMPTAPGKPFTTAPADIEPGRTRGKDIIAECVVTTEIPCAPAKIDGGVYFPTGTFKTTLAGPEIAYARENGATVEIGRGYFYRTSFALRDWAVFVLGLLAMPRTPRERLVHRMAKGWSRSTIGRFAGHTSRVVSTVPSDAFGWSLEVGHSLDTRRPVEYLTLAGTTYTSEHDLDGSDCFPAVLAFVEAHARTALAKMLATRNPGRVLQCNTDGWWERRVVRNADYQLEHVPEPFQVVRKACVNELRILGPDHLQTPQERRLSGVPRRATLSAEDSFVWHDWPSLRWQLEQGNAGEYHRPPRSVELAPSYAHRWVLESGETVPVTTSLHTDGSTRILTWPETAGRRNHDTLAPYQDPSLDALRGGSRLAPVVFDLAGPRLPGRRNWSTSGRSSTVTGKLHQLTAH